MGRADYFAPGDWNAICDQCGAKYKASEMLLQWDGFRVCRTCYDPRHPQDFVRPIPDPVPPPWIRMRPPVTNTPVSPAVSVRPLDGGPLDSVSMG